MQWPGVRPAEPEHAASVQWPVAGPFLRSGVVDLEATDRGPVGGAGRRGLRQSWAASAPGGERDTCTHALLPWQAPLEVGGGVRVALTVQRVPKRAVPTARLQISGLGWAHSNSQVPSKANRTMKRLEKRMKFRRHE